MQISKQKRLIKTGDIFILGDHRLLVGDATDKKNIKELVGKDKVRLIACDPPYGISYVESKAGFKQKIAKPKEIVGDQFQSDLEYRLFTKEWLEAIVPHLERKNSAYIFNCDKMIFALKDGMVDAGLYFSQLLVWIKNQAVVGRKDYLPQHELIAYGWHGTHLFPKSKDKSVIFCPKPSKSKSHPTQKPLSLMRRLILNSTIIGDFVYDPFGGSGSTLLASEQTKRKCLMIEQDIEYYETIIQRFEKLTNLKVKKLT